MQSLAATVSTRVLREVLHWAQQGHSAHVQQNQKQQQSPTITTKQQNAGQQWKVGHCECIQELYLHKELGSSQRDICQINHGRSGARPLPVLSSLTFVSKAGLRQTPNKCDFSWIVQLHDDDDYYYYHYFLSHSLAPSAGYVPFAQPSNPWYREGSWSHRWLLALAAAWHVQNCLRSSCGPSWICWGPAEHQGGCSHPKPNLSQAWIKAAKLHKQFPW